ncbi:MAG: hypothetical protein V1744_08270 [Candidatus Altiarchaeota archaeon]
MLPEINYALDILSVLCSITAAYLSYGIYRHNRLNKPWLAVTMAFILTIFHQTVGLIPYEALLPNLKTVVKNFEGILLLIISLLFVWGLWSMKLSFERYELLEKKTKEKVKAISSP